MFEHSHSQGVAVGQSTIGGGAKKYQGTGQTKVDESIANGVTNGVVNLTLDISQVTSLVIYSDKALTLKTNNSGAPTDTIVLKAGIPYVWNSDSYDTCKITADVTVLYVTNASGAAAALKFDAVHDATP